MKAWFLLLSVLVSACSGVADSATKTLPTDASSAASPTLTLSRYHWELSDAVDGKGARMRVLFDESEKPLQLDFTEKRVSVSHACNAISGDYLIVDGHLNTGALLQTMMACMSPSLQQRESVIKSALQEKPQLILTRDNGAAQMSLVAASGQTLTFTGKPTAQTRHGGPGDTVFLEVSAARMACHAAAVDGATCLRVRERHYDGNGLTHGTPAAWEALAHPIEDFTPQAGVRYVLRLKRFPAQPTSRENTPVYVLDTIIESGPESPSP